MGSSINATPKDNFLRGNTSLDLHIVTISPQMGAGRNNKSSSPNAFDWAGQPPKFPLPLGGLRPHIIMAHPSQLPQTDLNRFSRFAGLTHVTNTQT